MKNAEIIKAPIVTVLETKFKDERLTKATQRIAAIYSDAAKYAETKTREIAKILGDIQEKKAYEADGFKSVAEYAYTVFGIARQNAYALSNAGRVYNDKDAHPELKAMTPSKIAELSTVDEKVVKEALDTGKITKGTTQKELREFAAEARKVNEGEVSIQRYIVVPYMEIENPSLISCLSEAKTMDYWDDVFSEFVTSHYSDENVEVITITKAKSKPDSKTATITRKLYTNRGFSLVVEFHKFSKRKSGKEDQKFSREEVLKMLKESGDLSPTEDKKEEQK